MSDASEKIPDGDREYPLPDSEAEEQHGDDTDINGRELQIGRHPRPK